MPWGSPTLVLGWAAACAVFLGAGSGLAAELPGVSLDVVRDPGAASCPDARALAQSLRERLGSAPIAPGAPVVIEVEIRSGPGGFTATVRASGGKRGIRTLSAPGPTCDALREALVVSLLVLLDRDPERPDVVRPALEPPGPRPSLWLGTGIAMTHDLPNRLSATFFGEAGLRYLRHAIWAAMVLTPEREVPFDPGFVGLSAIGGQLRACTALFESERIRVDGCALGLLLSLRASARGYTSFNEVRRPWGLAGAGGELAFEPAPWFSAAVGARLLVAPYQEVFLIEGLGPAYETKIWAGWLGLSLSAKIW